MKFLIPFPDISELGPVPPLGVAPWWTVQSKSSWVSWVKSHRDPWSKLQYTVAKRKKIVKTIRQCLYGISINVFTLIIALLTGKKFILEIDDFFQFGALISQTWHFSNFNAVRVIELGINCDRAYLFGGVGGGAGGGDDRKPLRGSPALSTTASFERKLTRNSLVRLHRGTQWISSSKYLFFRQIFAGR